MARATLVDRLAAGGAQAVDFARLSRDPTFTLQEGQRSQAMTVYREKSYAAADLRYAQPGQYTLTVVASYPGFVTRRAQDVTVDVLATQDLALSLNAHRRLDCADCAPNQARLPYTDRADPVEVFAIQAQAEGAPGTGDYILTLGAPLPEGISVRLPNGQALTGTSAQFPLQPGQPAMLRLQYDRAYRAAQPVPVQLRLRPVQSLWQGEARMDLRLIPVVGAVDLRAAGHTGPDPQAPLVLPVTALNPGQGVYVQALHLLDPLDLEQLSISSDQAPFALALAGGDWVLVQPQKRWGCDCFTPSGEQSFTLDYRNARTGQQARYQGRVILTRGPWWAVCW